MSYNFDREYKFKPSKLELSRDLPLLIELLETLLSKYSIDSKNGDLPSLDFLNRSISEMNEHVGNLLDEYDRLLDKRDIELSQSYGVDFYENHYGREDHSYLNSPNHWEMNDARPD